MRVQTLPIEEVSRPGLAAAFSRASEVSFDLDADWFRNLATNARFEGESAFLAVAESPDSDRLCLPLLTRPNGDVAALVNYYSSYYAPVLSSDAAAGLLPELLRRQRKRNPRAARWWFYPLGTHESEDMARALRASGLVPFRYFCFGNWHLQCADMDWQSYLASRTSKMRSNIKRMTQKLFAAGGAIEVIMESSRQAEAIECFEQVRAASWKNDEPFPQFLPGLTRLAAEKGWLRMGVARLNGTPIAAQLWLVCKQRAAIYKVAYDEQLKEYSPGLVLTAHLMRHVLEQDKVTEVDYLIGDDDYKRAWMSARRERWGVVAYNPRTLRGLIGIAHEAIGRGFKTLRRAASR